jgi:alkylated DNA nucleotide flippase Atl1
VGGDRWWLVGGLLAVLIGIQITALGVLAGLVLKGLQAQTMPWFRIVESTAAG